MSTLNGTIEDLIDAYTKFFMQQVKKANKAYEDDEGDVRGLVYYLDKECDFRFPPLRKLGVSCCCYLTQDHPQPAYVLTKIRIELAFRGVASRKIEVLDDEDGLTRHTLHMHWKELYDGDNTRPPIETCCFLYTIGRLPTSEQEITKVWNKLQTKFMSDIIAVY